MASFEQVFLSIYHKVVQASAIIHAIGTTEIYFQDMLNKAINKNKETRGL